MSRDEQVAAALERLFSTYQQFGRSDDPADRVKAASAYFEAVLPYQVRDIEAAVTNFLNGSVPGVNLSFAPPAPAVGAEVRRVMNLRLDRESRGVVRNQLPPPTIERTDESRARVMAQMQAFTATNADGDRIAEQARREGWAKVNARFDADLAAMPDRERLKRLGYTAGDPDADTGDMGQGKAA